MVREPIVNRAYGDAEIRVGDVREGESLSVKMLSWRGTVTLDGTRQLVCDFGLVFSFSFSLSLFPLLMLCVNK